MRADPFAAQARDMVEHQLRRRGIRDERVLDAMGQVPRHQFVPRESEIAAYEDRPLPIGDQQTISQPYIVALMTAAVEVAPGEKALEVGTGSGYQAAVLARLGATVYTIEANVRLAEAARARLRSLGYGDVQVYTGDGSEGLAEHAPYDVIVVTAAAPRVPPALLGQLAEGGRLIAPVGTRFFQELVLVRKRGGQVATNILGACQFVPLVGKGGWKGGYE